VSTSAQKTPVARSLELFANRKVRSALATLGQSLPATVVSITGGIVTVKFALTSPYTLPNVTVPIIGSEYVRLPIQAGCPGFVLSADAYLGGMSGLGGGTADLSPRGNLSMLVWTPIGNKAWQAVIDANAIELYGPDGGIIRTADKTSIVRVSSAGTVITVPVGTSVQIVNLPTAPTGGPGSLWNSGGTVHVV
jgi:hypothetical protein